MKRTKIGTLLYNILYKMGTKLDEKAILILNYTWGIVWTLVGWLVYCFIKIFLKSQIVSEGKFLFNKHVTMKGNWGGVSLGNVFLTSENSSLYTNCHECGHTIQNAILGPLFIFLVAIPSGIRYQYQRRRTLKGLSNKPYDQIWFEGNASDLGKSYYTKEN